MPVNYYKTAFRALLKRKSFSLINIAGLTLGLTATLLIALFVWDEYQYDKFVPDGDRIYRLCNQVTHNEGTEPLAVTPPTYSSVLQLEFPGVEATTRVLATGEFKSLFEAGGKAIYETNGMYADSAFFRVFQLPFIFGNPAGALNDPSSIVLSREMANRYFGNEDPVGKKLLIDKKLVQVTGVIDKNPKFHLSFNYLRPLAALDIASDRLQSWQWQQFFTYIRLRNGADINGMQATFSDIVKARAYPETKPKGYTYLPFFQPLYGIHLYSAGFKFNQGPRGNITYIRALLIIAAFIIVIACFNFINLATALSARRAKEVGVRKTIGAGKWQLIRQFIGETLLLTAISILLALILTALLLPSLNSFTGATIPFSILIRPVTIALGAALTLIVGLAAGFYPAIILSGYDPIKVLKPGLAQSGGSIKMPWLRHGLVVIQFTLSILLILSAITVFGRMHRPIVFNMLFRHRQRLFTQKLRPEGTRHHYRGFDTQFGNIQCQGFGKTYYCKFGRIINAPAGAARCKPGNGRDVNDMTGMLFAHSWQRIVHCGDHSEYIDFEIRPDLFQTQFFRGSAYAITCIIDHYIQSTEIPLCL
jgi:putative ABC transport system permease protein